MVKPLLLVVGFVPKVRYGLNAVVRQAHHERMMIRKPLILSLSKDAFRYHLHCYTCSR